MITAAYAGLFDSNKDPLRIEPKGTVSLEYPNPWDINNQIALSNDGSRLIDATPGARYIRVWDWQNNKVVQQLLLNEEAPEGNGSKPNKLMLDAWPGKELALSPDGRLMAACASTGKGETRVWNLESGTIVADISTLQRHVPNQNQEKIFGLACDSISFSPDGKYIAVLSEIGGSYANESELAEIQTVNKINGESIQASLKAGKAIPPLIKPKSSGTPITGIAVFETNNWKLERLFYRPAYRQPTFKSRPLFDADSKTVSAVLFDHISGDWNKWAGNRIVRWDIATGAQLEEQDMPQLVELPSNGLWWTPLPGGREVWWKLDRRTSSWGQTDKEIEQCKQAPPLPPAFISDKKSNCAYEWLLAILNLDTGKIRYLVPAQKGNPLIKGTDESYWANISPDGAYVASFHTTEKSQKRLHASSSVEVHSMKSQQIVGRYSGNMRFGRKTVFSGDSRYVAFSVNTTSYDWAESALIFELLKNK